MAAPAPATGSALSFGALMMFTTVLVLAPQALWPRLSILRLALVAATVGMGAHVYDSLTTPIPLVRPTLTTGLAFGLVAWSAVTVPFSYWPGGSASLLLDVYLKALLIFWLLGAVVNTLSRLRRLVMLLSLLMLPLAFTAIRNYAEGAFVPAGAVRRIFGYDAPLTQNPNDLALMLNLVLPLTLGLFLVEERLIVRIALGLGATVSAAAVVLTFSRAGFLCLAGTCLAYFAKTVRRGFAGWAAAALVVAALAAPFVPRGYLDRLSTISDFRSDPTRSAQLRWADMVLAARFVVEHPFEGAGIGMNALALNDIRGPAWKQVHNAYLQYGVDLGVPGVVVFLGLLASSTCDVRRVERRLRDAASASGLVLRSIAGGVGVSLLTFALAAFFHPIAYQFYFFYVGGLAVAARGVCEREFAP